MMRKLLALGAAGLLTALPSTGTAIGKTQVVEGEIALVARHPQLPDDCFSGAHRRATVVSNEAFPNGAIGYHFDVDKKSWKKPFVLEVTGGHPVPAAVDLDITFYTEFGTLEQAAETGYAPPSFSYAERQPGGEKGKVPKGMNRAIVCMYDGADSTFTYTAKLGKKK